jgi:hypothetical protein
VIAITAGVLLVPALTAGYGWSERDWNGDGHTSFGEFFEATDIRTRPVTRDARTCVEYFRLKDGLSVRIDCPTSTGVRVRSTNWAERLSPINADSVSQFGLAEPDCTGTERWPTSMALIYLKDAGLTDYKKLDIGKTRTVRLASEKIGPNLYRQVHDVVFTQKSGTTLEVITANDATNDECSGSGVQVYVVSKRLGGYDK